MKRFISLVPALGIILSLAGCGGEKQDIAGLYKDMSVSLIVATTQLMLSDSDSSSGPIVAVTLESDGDNYRFVDDSYKGTAAVDEDGILIFNREESISSATAIREMQNDHLERYPEQRKDSYIVYKDYIINTVSSVETEYGDLPEGKPSAFGIEEKTTLSNPYSMNFFADGSCELEGENISGAKTSAAGTYTVDGKIINITLTNCGDEDGNIYEGEVEFCLFVEDGTVYNSVYKKIS